MGRAIVREPQAFLFDEPLSNLDAKLRVQMRVEIRRLHNRLKATSMFVTHDQVEAMTLADTVVVMNEGRIEQVGAPTEVYRRPATRFVATFIGSPAMNLMPGPSSPPAWSRPAAAGGLRGRLSTAPRPAGGGRHPAGGFALGLARGRLAFTRDFVEELGATRLLHGNVGETQVVVASVDAPPKGASLVLSQRRPCRRAPVRSRKRHQPAAVGEDELQAMRRPCF